MHLHFGDPLESGLDVSAVVAAIDEQMVRHYRLYPTNAWAWERLFEKTVPDYLDIHPGSISRQSFDTRIAAVPEAHRERLLTMYANPVSRVLALREQSQDPHIG